MFKSFVGDINFVFKFLFCDQVSIFMLKNQCFMCYVRLELWIQVYVEIFMLKCSSCVPKIYVGTKMQSL